MRLFSALIFPALMLPFLAGCAQQSGPSAAESSTKKSAPKPDPLQAERAKAAKVLKSEQSKLKDLLSQRKKVWDYYKDQLAREEEAKKLIEEGYLPLQESGALSEKQKGDWDKANELIDKKMEKIVEERDEKLAPFTAAVEEQRKVVKDAEQKVEELKIS